MEIIRSIGGICTLLLLSFLVNGCSSSDTAGAAVASHETLEIKGSDTLVQVVSNLAEAYSKRNPATRLSVTGGGSGTGLAALLNGEVAIADSSRPISEKELKLAAERGLNPLEVIIGRDMLSVIVHKDNPLIKLTVDQISRIYKGEINNWKDVGGQDQPITLYGRQSTSGTYVFFMEHVVQGDYSPSMRNMEGTQAILEAVRQDKSGIGYVGRGYIADAGGKLLPGITALDVAWNPDGPYISPLDVSRRVDYPVSRPLFQYFAERPARASAAYNFLMFELSEEGQKIVEQSGFVPFFTEDVRSNEAALAPI